MKSKRSKERVQQRKENQLKKDKASGLINAANAITDPLSTLSPAFQSYKARNTDWAVSVEFKRAVDMTPAEKQACFSRLKENMKDIYESAVDFGWDDKEKWDEVFDNSALMLLCRQKDKEELVGFVNFRFDLDDLSPVVYCYEVQLAPWARGRGLGRFLVQILLLLCHKSGLEKVILTVFKHNPRAVSFFRALKFELDETDPFQCDGNEAPSYYIMSRTMGKA